MQETSEKGTESGDGSTEPYKLQAPSTSSKQRFHDDSFELQSPVRPKISSMIIDFIRPAILSKRSKDAKPLRSTAYLDGLRGVAAFVVYLAHHQSWAHPNETEVMEYGFGYDGNQWFCCLPIIRIFFTGGHFAVANFFIISGFVLSRGPLQLIHEKRYADIAQTLASAIFRRGIRLYIPVLATTFCFFTIWHLGSGVWTAYPPHQATYAKELENWVCEFINYSYIFRDHGHAFMTYNLHSWSIPTEYKGSLVVYGTLLAFSRTATQARLLLTCALIFYNIFIVNGWFACLFLIGMLFAEIDLLAQSDTLPGWRLLQFLQKHKNTALRLSLFLGLLLGSQPPGPGFFPNIETLLKSPGWYYLAQVIPAACADFKWFWLTWAAALTVISVIHTPWLRKLFEMRFAQYLGRISFSLYLVHGPVLWIVADRLYTAVGRTREGQNLGILGWKDILVLPNFGPVGLEFNYLACHLIILPVTLYLSEIATKAFDEPSVKIARWVHSKTL